MRCRSCNVLNMHALGKRVTQISMNARAVAGVNEVNCLGMLGCGMWGQLLIGCEHNCLMASAGVIFAGNCLLLCTVCLSAQNGDS